MKTPSFTIAVLGATGHVGREILQVLATHGVPRASVHALATVQALGSIISYGDDDEIDVNDAAVFDFTTVDMVISATPADAAQKLLPNIARQGVKVIDCSTAFRMDRDVPLMVAGVNDDMLATARTNIVALPDAVACILAQVLHPLHRAVGVVRAVVSTYQATASEGRAAMDELFNQTRAVFVNDPIVKEQFPKQIAFNVIPQVGNFRDDGQTDAEFMLMAETKRVVDAAIKISPTCVRVPSFLGTALAVAVECRDELDVNAARAALRKNPNISVVDHRAEEGYATPVEVAGEDNVYVSRVRDDSTVDYGLSLWVVADTIRAGVALNAVRTALAWAALAGQKMPRASTLH
jgi:aspartate-semialdehyde dehydrogenase